MVTAKAASPRRIPQPATNLSLVSKGSSSPKKIPWKSSKDTKMSVTIPANDDDVRDGKFFHVRLHIAELTGLTIIQLFSKDRGDESTASSSIGGKEDEVRVYAAIETGDEGNLNYSISLPINPSLNKQNVKWSRPKGPDDQVMSRRLYHSLLMRTDGSLARTNDKTPSSIYAPAQVKIQLGFMRDNHKIPLGVSTILLQGNDICDEKMEFAVKAVVKSKPKEIEKKPSRGLRTFLNKGPKKKDELMKTTDTPLPTFPRDDKLYRVPENATLRVRLDVVGGSYETSGPGFWGDVEGDKVQDESISHVSPVDSPESCRGEVTNKYVHESIEVMNDRLGTTILSSPGSQLASVDDDMSVSCSGITPFSGSNGGDNSTAMFSPGALCGVNIKEEHYREIDKNYSFASTLPDLDDAKQSLYSMSLPPALLSAMARLTEIDNEEERDDATATDLSGFNKGASFGEDDTNDNSGQTSHGSGIDTVGLESVDKAKATLQRYASQLGVDIEDLLDQSTI